MKLIDKEIEDVDLKSLGLIKIKIIDFDFDWQKKIE